MSSDLANIIQTTDTIVEKNKMYQKQILVIFFFNFEIIFKE